MIATGLIFLLGALTASFIALLISPLVWRKAQRLARRDFDASIPTTANEIRAGLDRVRAEAAMNERRHEMRAKDAMETAAKERAEAGRIAAQNAEMRVRERNLEEQIGQQDEELLDVRGTIAAHEDEILRLTSALRDTQQDLDLRVEEMDALAGRFGELTDIAEERKIQIVSLETKLERISDSLRSTERRGRDLQETIDRLRGDIAGLEAGVKREKTHSAALESKVTRLTARLADRDEEISRLRQRHGEEGEGSGRDLVTARELPAAGAMRGRSVVRSQWSTPTAREAEPLTPGTVAKLEAETASLAAQARAPSSGSDGLGDEEMRERINEIAARVIRMMAIAEGPDSPIEKLIEESSDERRPDGVVTLAERVRLLMREDQRGGEAAPTASREVVGGVAQ